jgi:hypothetical protein
MTSVKARFGRKNNSVMEQTNRNANRYGNKAPSTFQKRNNFYEKRVYPIMLAERESLYSDPRKRFKS